VVCLPSLLVNGLTQAKCHLCGEVFPIDKDGCGKKYKKLATVHHLFFPAKLFQYPSKSITTEERKFLRRYYRECPDHQAVLCMHKNGDGIKGCHDYLNTQLSNRCLGIGPINNGSENTEINGNIIIGRCPLIFGIKPKDPKLIVPNELCEFCFLFQFLCDPLKYQQAIVIINKIDSFEGDISVDSLFIAQKRLRNDGYEVKKIVYPIGNVKGSYISRYKPVLQQPIILKS
jgi:hypothetical protein